MSAVWKKRSAVASVLGLLGAAISVGPLFAQSTVQEHMMLDGSTVRSAGSILSPHQTSGRFGSQTTGGYLSPTPTSKFSSGGFIYSPDGAFLGFNTDTPNSRFHSYWEQPSGEMPSETNADLLELRQYKNSYNAALAAEEPAANPEQRSAVRPSNTVPERQAEERSGIVEAFPERGAVEQPFRNSGQAQEVWMRGAPQGKNQPKDGFSLAPGAYQPPAQNAQSAPNAANAPVDLGSRFVGGALPAMPETEQMPAIPISAARTAADPNASVREYLELMLLRSPTVNPLSPIQVTFDGGRATVRGIVPAEMNRVEAGRILLTDPRVKTVDNKLTVLPTDMNSPTPSSFDPNLPPQK